MFSAKYNYVLDANKPVIKLSMTKGSILKMTILSFGPLIALTALGAYANARDEKLAREINDTPNN